MDDKVIDYKDYASLREKIVLENENLLGVILNNDEIKADKKLKKLKEDFILNCKGKIPFNMPVLKDSRIYKSKLYDFCLKLPKGSDLHVHGTALLPMDKMIDFIIKEERLLIDPKTFILHTDKKKNYLPLKKALKDKVIKRSDLLKKWTILGLKKNQDPWPYFEDLFSYHNVIDEDLDILYEYYIEAFRYYLSVNVYHLELHVLLSEDLNSTLNTVNTIKKAYFKVKEENNNLSVCIIGTSMKMFDSLSKTKKILKNILYAHENILDDFDSNNVQDFVTGADLVNEEDASRSLKDYAKLLIEIKKSHPDFEYYLHCGESINANSNNLIDAYLLKTERVGHGTNLYKYPKLLKEYADNEICLESCLISNQVLGYVYDLRLHPSAEYLKRGVTISLCSDDPIYFEKNSLVDDFFAAIICWDLGIAEIKQLCINSIMYSGLNKNNKRKLLKSWNDEYSKFIKAMQ